MNGFAENCNDLGFGFVYYLEGGSNAPSNYCWIITLVFGNDKGQLAWSFEGAWRRRYSAGNWSNWAAL